MSVHVDISVLENWLSMCMSCVKWGSAFSYFYEMKCGVRQGGVLSPFLFAIFIDDLVQLIDAANIGCKTGGSCIFLYADDIILLAPSAQALQSLVDICELELKRLDMAINASKSACMRFGPRYKSTCANVTVSGLKINWVAVKALNDSTRRSATVDTGSDSLMCWWSTVIDSRGMRDSPHVLEMDNVRDVT